METSEAGSSASHGSPKAQKTKFETTVRRLKRYFITHEKNTRLRVDCYPTAAITILQ